MTFGDILLPIILGALLLYSGRNLFLAFRTGRMSLPGGAIHDRARHPSSFWQAVGFEALLFVIMSFILVRQVS